MAQLVEHSPTDPLGHGLKPSNCHIVPLGKTLHSHLLGLKSFTNISPDICGLVPDRLFTEESSAWVSSRHSGFLPQLSGN